MKKLAAIFFGLILMFNLAYAETGISDASQEIENIGTVRGYQIGKNMFIGMNVNLELLYIATATGCGFTHPAYGFAKNDIAESIKAYYRQFQNNAAAQRLNQISLGFMNIPQRRFPNYIVQEILSYGLVMSPARVSIGNPEAAILKVGDELKQFYDQTDSKAFFKENLFRYNEMIRKTVAIRHFDYVGRLEELLGFAMSQDQFAILLSPMYYGAEALQIENLNHTKTCLCIINPYGNDEEWLVNTITHEFAHDFLQPVLERNRDVIDDYQQDIGRSFGKATGFIKDDYYSFLNEMLARTITIALADQYRSREIASRLWMREKKLGWPYLDDLYALIKNKYLAQREKYHDFDSFLPVILEYFKAKSMGRSFDVGPKVLREI